MRYFIATASLLLMLGGVRSAGAMDKDFDPHTIPVITLGSYPFILKPGTGFVQGYLRAKTKLFGEVTYPNEEVLLMPNSPFSIWYIQDVAYMIENPHAKDALANYPTDLVKYTKTVKSDENGFFEFTGLPDGKYYIWTYLEHEVDSNPIRQRSQLAMGPDGEMVSVPTFREGLKIRSDDVVIAGDATIDSKAGIAGQQINGFNVVGEYTCCSAEL